MMSNNFGYFYGIESEYFIFFRIPKLLITDKRFNSISAEAKLLYGLMLDRMGLSCKNGWIDECNRVYIVYTVDEIIEDIGCARQKAAKLLEELENAAGLIERKRQGLGKPNIIYIKNFSAEETKTDVIANERADEKQEVRKSNLQKYENQTSGSMNFKKQEVRKSYSNNTNINNTDFNNNNPILSYQSNTYKYDGVNDRERYRQYISMNIEEDVLSSNYGQEIIDGIVEIMMDAVCSNKEYLCVGCDEIPQTVVKSRLLKLRYGHIEYVLECMKKNATDIRNIKNYLLTALYNSYSTIDHYYNMSVNQEIRI